MEFEFRQSISLVPDDRIEAPDSCLHLPGSASHMNIMGARFDLPIVDYPRVFLVGGPYPSAEEARRDGSRARRAVLLWALERRIPIDLGDSIRRGGITDYGIALLSQQIDAPVREQLDGLDVYEFKEGQKFVRTEAQASRRIDPLSAAHDIADWYTEDRKISDKQELAAELFCLSNFDSQLRSRFLTLMTALETLLEYKPRPTPVIELVQLIEMTVRESRVSDTEKQSLAGSLKWLRNESISQAGRRMADTLLAGRTYDGRTPSKYFSSCYELRSSLVHSGQIADGIDMLTVSNTLQQFTGDLLLASIATKAA
jgi:hypothetical protein